MEENTQKDEKTGDYVPKITVMRPGRMEHGFYAYVP
jgi:hypothetical protein